MSTKLIENLNVIFLLTTMGVVGGLGPIVIVAVFGCKPVIGMVQVSIELPFC